MNRMDDPKDKEAAKDRKSKAAVNCAFGFLRQRVKKEPNERPTDDRSRPKV